MVRHSAAMPAIFETLALGDRSWEMNVIEKGGIRGESLLAHKLFRVKSPAGAVKTDMALAGNFPRHPVVRHIVSLDAEATRASTRPPGHSPFQASPLRAGDPPATLRRPGGCPAQRVEPVVPTIGGRQGRGRRRRKDKHPR